MVAADPTIRLFSMDVIRTPEARFSDLPDYGFDPHYTLVPDGEGGELRIHHLDEGDSAGPPVLCLHGEPTWSYLYRKMVKVFSREGLRTIAPDFVGFGRSDKPTSQEDYSYQRHVDWMTAWLERNDLYGLTLVCQDWGGLIGLRLVAENPDRFERVVAANTGFPTGRHLTLSEEGATHGRHSEEILEAARKHYEEIPVVSLEGLAAQIAGPDGFLYWRKFATNTPDLPVGALIAGTIAGAAGRPLSDSEVAAYEAPFPDERYKAGASRFPGLVPLFPDDPAASANQAAWEKLGSWSKPFLTAFGDRDAMMRGFDKVFQEHIPGAQGQPHTIIEGAGHFLQDDHGEELARIVVDFVRSNPAA